MNPDQNWNLSSRDRMRAPFSPVSAPMLALVFRYPPEGVAKQSELDPTVQVEKLKALFTPVNCT
jgi:hypothetical protein